MYSKIKVTDSTESATIDIEGVIGMPENAQSDDDRQTVSTYARMKEALDEIGALNAPEVVVNIRSTGGDVNDALLIYDAVMALGRHVITRCYGYAASAATIIAQAASPGCRQISANALYLIHCCESSCAGNSQSLLATKELLDKTDSRIASIYSERSGCERAQFVELMNVNGGKGRWLTPDETVGFGLADSVIASAPIGNFVAEQVAALGLPPLPSDDVRPSWVVRLTDRWKRVRNLLGGSHAGVLTEQGLDAIDRALAGVAGVAPLTLNDRVERLFDGDRQASAVPAQTLPKEDPGFAECLRTPNQLAYDADLCGMLRREH